MLNVIEDHGQFFVEDQGNRVAGPFPSHARAWKAADRLSGDPVNQSEKRFEFVTRKILLHVPGED